MNRRFYIDVQLMPNIMIKICVVQNGAFCPLFDVIFSFCNPVPPPGLKMSFTYFVYICSDISLSKGLLGSKGGVRGGGGGGG